MPGSKSISFQQKGLEFEAVALQQYLSFGYKLIAKRRRVAGVEVDLLMQSKDRNFVVVEVKSDTGDNFRSWRVSQRQQQRLKRAALCLADRYQCSVRIDLALVDSARCVHIYDEDGLSMALG